MHVSNHILSTYLRATMPAKQWIDLELAYKLSRLLLAMITEPEKVDYALKEMDGENFTPGDFDQAYKMAGAFRNSVEARALLGTSTGRQIFYRDEFILDRDGFKFDMPAQCSFHIWQPGGWGCQIKSTNALSLDKFIQMAQDYDYDRERAWCMDVANTNQDILIGISKKNYKVFLLPIRRGDPIHQSGQKKYLQLAHKLHIDQNIF